MNSSVLAALQLYKYGLTPIPLVDKRPILKGWSNIFNDRPIKQHEIINGIANSEGRVSHYDNKNIGIVTGAVSNCIVLDIDNLASLSKLEKMGPIPFTWKVRSNRGIHLYFNYTDQVRSMKLWDSIDVLSDKKQVVAPPSIHPSGTVYRWEVSPKQVEKAELPRWLIEYLLQHGNQNIKKSNAKKPTTLPVYKNKPKLNSKDIENMLEKVDWLDFYTKNTSNIKGRGIWLSAKCPFHHDQHNSFSFNVKNGAWTCFAGCGSGGAIKLIQLIYGLTFHETIRIIKGENLYVE